MFRYIYIYCCLCTRVNKKKGCIPCWQIVIGYTEPSENDDKKKEEKIERTDNFTFSERNPLIYA